MTVPAKCITVEQAENLQNTWVATRQLAIDRSLGEPDTREFFFTVAELEEFLDYVKTNSEDTDPGIRIYFGAYNSLTNSHATVFLAPTKGEAHGHENNYELQPLNMAIGKIPPTNFDSNGLSIPAESNDVP